MTLDEAIEYEIGSGMLNLPQIVKPIPYAIIVWLKDGSKVVYIAEAESEVKVKK